MNKQEARRLALVRAVSVLQGDLQIGGLGAALENAGYSAADILKIEQAYKEQIISIQAKIEKVDLSTHENRKADFPTHENK